MTSNCEEFSRQLTIIFHFRLTYFSLRGRKKRRCFIELDAHCIEKFSGRRKLREKKQYVAFVGSDVRLVFFLFFSVSKQLFDIPDIKSFWHLHLTESAEQIKRKKNEENDCYYFQKLLKLSDQRKKGKSDNFKIIFVKCPPYQLSPP